MMSDDGMPSSRGMLVREVDRRRARRRVVVNSSRTCAPYATTTRAPLVRAATTDASVTPRNSGSRTAGGQKPGWVMTGEASVMMWPSLMLVDRRAAINTEKVNDSVREYCDMPYTRLTGLLSMCTTETASPSSTGANVGGVKRTMR